MAEDTLFYKTMTASTLWATNIASGSDSEATFPGGRSGYLNLPRDYAAANRKNMRHTDNKGYPLCYVVEVEAVGNTSNAQEIEIFTAPETWVLKNAVRKWHFARNAMLERLGMLGQVGEYGKTIRPYLTVGHANLENASLHSAIPDMFEPNYQTTYSSMTESNQGAVHKASLGMGEWTYTEVAATSDHEDQAAGNYPVDRYSLVVTGDHSDNVGSDSSGARTFTHVSMVRSYLESRRNPSSMIQDASGAGTIQAEPSPLLTLLADSSSSGEVKEIVQDIQREKPPYQAFTTADSNENALGGNSAQDLVSKCHLVTSTSYPKDKEVIRVPMGLMHVRTTATGGDTPSLRIRLLGIDKCQG